MKHADLMAAAFRAAENSPDPSTQNGAILATVNGEPLWGTSACNEFPFGVKYSDERWLRPPDGHKYDFIEHAERNAIYAAARVGIETRGLVMFCPWAACSDCARAIIQARLSKLVTLPPEVSDASTPDRWSASISIAMTMLEESPVEVEFFNEPLPQVPVLRRNGEAWWPK